MSANPYSLTRCREAHTKAATCSECGYELLHDEVAIKRDGEILCEQCLKKFFADDIATAIEWLTDHMSVTHGYDFEETVTVEYVQAWHGDREVWHCHEVDE